MPIKGLVGQRDGAARKDRLLALTASGIVAEPSGGDAVGRLAIWADDDLS